MLERVFYCRCVYCYFWITLGVGSVGWVRGRGCGCGGLND